MYCCSSEEKFIGYAFGTTPKTVLRTTQVLAQGRFFYVSKVLCFLVVKVKPYNWLQ